MDNPPDFIHLFFHQFWRILKISYPSQTVSSVKTADVDIC